MICPCKNCLDRHSGCHSKCEAFAVFSENNQRANTARRDYYSSFTIREMGEARRQRAKIKQIWAWLRKNVLNKEMFVFVLIAEVIFWSPCIVTALLAILINPWYWGAFSAICLFWAGPVTPAMPLQYGLAVLLRKIWHKIKCIKTNKSVYNKNDGGKNGKHKN